MPSFETNFVAIIVAAVANMGLGAFWYSMSGFGKTWIKLSGISKEDIEKAKKAGMTQSYVIASVGSLVMACVLGVLTYYLGTMTLMGGMKLGILVWLGFIAPAMLGQVLWENKSWTLYALNAGYYLVSLSIMGAILALF